MPPRQPSGVFDFAPHACNDDCMLFGDEEECRHDVHPLRQDPQNERDEGQYGILLAPSPALTSDRSTCYSPRPPSPIEDFPSIPTRNGHQRSWTSNFKLPPLVAQTASRASLSSPTKTLSNWISSQAVPQDGPPPSPSKQRANPLSDWFVGTSAPVQLGIPTRSRRDSQSPTRIPEDFLSSDDMAEGYTSRPRRTRRSSTATSSPASAGLTSKLWGLTKSITNATSNLSARPATTSDPSDELLNLDVSHALLPHGVPDILAPSSFHDLLTASTDLLARYQSAYRAKCSAVSEIELERSAQHEELEEAETRARHLKMQLDGMAEKAKEQEEAMRALGLELLAERRRREDEDAARKMSVQAVARSGPTTATTKEHQHQRRRGTAASHAGSSVGSVCDSGFESDGESAPDYGSVAGMSFHSGPTLAGEDEYSTDAGSVRRGPLPQRRLSTYDKVLRTVAGEPASAWAVMEGYREENRALRDRIHELEGAVDSALDLVAGVGM